MIGDIHARVDGRVVDVGPARQRCVLVALLIDANRVVPVDVLVDRVWAGRPPQRARGALHNYVSRLRRALSPLADVRIGRDSGGYVVTVDPMTVDVHRFGHLIERARAAPGDVGALALLEEALALWRGDAFAGLDTPWLATVRDDLGRRRWAAELDRNDLALRGGRHARLVSDLPAAAATHPFDERLAGQLMVALYRCGRQADALGAYEGMRRRLADDLGADPGPSLKDLHLRILRADPALAAPAVPAPAVSAPVVPAPVVPAIGSALGIVGWTVAGRAPTIGVVPVPRGGRPPVPRPHRVGVVPALADGFWGRTAGDTVTGRSADGWAVAPTRVLSGLGGVGKTQIAAAVADGVCRNRAVDLLVWVTATSRDAILAGYAHAAAEILAGAGAGTGTGDVEEAAGRLLAWLAGTEHRWLIVLDGLRAPADLTGLWPPAGETGQVLVTTRRRDAALGGSNRRMIDVGPFTAAESAGFLTARLAGTGPDDVAGLAADLGHLPLALAQAVAYMLDRGLTCAAYRRRFASRGRWLTDLLPERESLPDQQTATVATTWLSSVRAADRLHPAGVAGPLLDLVSLLDPDGVPTEVLTTRAVRSALTGRMSARAVVTVDDVGDALHNLHRVNLVTVDALAGTVRTHALVQRATRDLMSPTDLAAAIAACADALTEVWPDVDRDPGAAPALLANAATFDAARRRAAVGGRPASPVPAGRKEPRRRRLPGAAVGLRRPVHHRVVRATGAGCPHALTTRPGRAG